jgi:hypothetical protein
MNPSMKGHSGAAFYCVADDRYFLGAVGMINSLRLLGHGETIYLLDIGLTPRQRDILQREVTILPGPRDALPYVLKTVAPLRHPAEVMVLIDADFVVTRPLDELIARAAESRVVAMENDMDRFVAQWGEVLGLGEVRRQPYVSSGLVLLGQPIGTRVLTQVDGLAQRVNPALTVRKGGDPSYPLHYPEQDILNAVLASRVDADRTVALSHRLAPYPPFPGVRVVDKRTLRCSYRDGTQPFALHHFGTKPWLEPARDGPYSRLLRRLLTGPDVPIPIDERELPSRLRSGFRPWLGRKRVDASETFHWHVREPLAAKLGGRRE